MTISIIDIISRLELWIIVILIMIVIVAKRKEVKNKICWAKNRFRTLIKFEIAGAILTVVGLPILFLIDLFELSAFWTILILIPPLHLLKYVLYKKIFIIKKKIVHNIEGKEREAQIKKIK